MARQATNRQLYPQHATLFVAWSQETDTLRLRDTREKHATGGFGQADLFCKKNVGGRIYPVGIGQGSGCAQLLGAGTLASGYVP